MLEEKFSDYKKGEEIKGYTIDEICFSATNYIIFKSKNGVHHDESEDYTKKLNAVSEEISTIMILVEDDVIKEQNIYSKIALAWRDCFEDNPDVAKTNLQNLIQKWISGGRNVYITGAFHSFVVSFVIGLFVLCICHNTLYYNQFMAELILIIKIFISGSLGGLISVLIKINDLFLDPLSKTINRLSGISRTIIAGVSSLIFYLGYKADIIFSFAKTNPSKEMYLILLLSFFAGFSERFLPDFSNKLKGTFKF